MNSWDPVWEEIFRTRKWGKYPPEELVRFVARNYYGVPDRKAIRILDLGCGPGSCLWYLAREGFSAYGIDASPEAIGLAGKRLRRENLSAELFVGDITRLPWPEKFFDAVIDSEALSCNRMSASQAIVSEVHRVLKPGGKFCSITFKDGSWGDGLGKPLGEHTYRDIVEGPCADIGVVRFSTEQEIKKLYGLFGGLALEYKQRSLENRRYGVSEWIVTCEKTFRA